MVEWSVHGSVGVWSSWEQDMVDGDPCIQWIVGDARSKGGVGDTGGKKSVGPWEEERSGRCRWFSGRLSRGSYKPEWKVQVLVLSMSLQGRSSVGKIGKFCLFIVLTNP